MSGRLAILRAGSSREQFLSCAPYVVLISSRHSSCRVHRVPANEQKDASSRMGRERAIVVAAVDQMKESVRTSTQKKGRAKREHTGRDTARRRGPK